MKLSWLVLTLMFSKGLFIDQVLHSEASTVSVDFSHADSHKPFKPVVVDDCSFLRFRERSTQAAPGQILFHNVSVESSLENKTWVKKVKNVEFDKFPMCFNVKVKNNSETLNDITFFVAQPTEKQPYIQNAGNSSTTVNFTLTISENQNRFIDELLNLTLELTDDYSTYQFDLETSTQKTKINFSENFEHLLKKIKLKDFTVLIFFGIFLILGLSFVVIVGCVQDSQFKEVIVSPYGIKNSDQTMPIDKNASRDKIITESIDSKFHLQRHLPLVIYILIARVFLLIYLGTLLSLLFRLFTDKDLHSLVTAYTHLEKNFSQSKNREALDILKFGVTEITRQDSEMYKQQENCENFLFLKSSEMNNQTSLVKEYHDEEITKRRINLVQQNKFVMQSFEKGRRVSVSEYNVNLRDKTKLITYWIEFLKLLLRLFFSPDFCSDCVLDNQDSRKQRLERLIQTLQNEFEIRDVDQPSVDMFYQKYEVGVRKVEKAAFKFFEKSQKVYEKSTGSGKKYENAFSLESFIGDLSFIENMMFFAMCSWRVYYGINTLRICIQLYKGYERKVKYKEFYQITTAREVRGMCFKILRFVFGVHPFVFALFFIIIGTVLGNKFLMPKLSEVLKDTNFTLFLQKIFSFQIKQLQQKTNEMCISNGIELNKNRISEMNLHFDSAVNEMFVELETFNEKEKNRVEKFNENFCKKAIKLCENNNYCNSEERTNTNDLINQDIPENENHENLKKNDVVFTEDFCKNEIITPIEISTDEPKVTFGSKECLCNIYEDINVKSSGQRRDEFCKRVKITPRNISVAQKAEFINTKEEKCKFEKVKIRLLLRENTEKSNDEFFKALNFFIKEAIQLLLICILFGSTLIGIVIVHNILCKVFFKILFGIHAIRNLWIFERPLN